MLNKLLLISSVQFQVPCVRPSHNLRMVIPPSPIGEEKVIKTDPWAKLKHTVDSEYPEGGLL